MRLRRLVGWSLVAVFGLGAQCAEGSGDKAPAPPPPQAKKTEHLTVFVEGVGQHVWLLLVVDGRTEDTHTDLKLPYRRDIDVSFGVKVEARNGPQDGGSIGCKFTDARGATVGEPQSAYGASKLVRCIHDKTRA